MKREKKLIVNGFFNATKELGLRVIQYMIHVLFKASLNYQEVAEESHQQTR